jgi:hypothetical protein
MNIELSGEDLRKMPPNLVASLVNWLHYERLRPATTTSNSQGKSDVEQLSLALNSNSKEQDSHTFTKAVDLVKAFKAHQDSKEHHHIRLTQLFAAGITKAGMPVRVKLKQELAKQRGYEYVTKELSISRKGTVLYKTREFDKPSPLATQVNGSPINGWEYVEVMKDGQWVCLNELRRIWRTAS